MENKASRKATVLVLVVFLLGIALGAVGMRVVGNRVWGSQVEGKGHHEPRAQVVERLARELSLTPEQQKQLDAILADTWGQFRAVHEQMEPQLDRARQQGRERIRAILTPVQRPKFEEFVRRIDEERKRKASQ